MPAWLPDPHAVNPWTEATFEALYEVFCETLRDSRAILDGHQVWFFPEMEDGREVIFWHLTHRDDADAGDRIPDLRRCERLPWVRPMLDHPADADVLFWDNEEANKDIKTYVWLKDESFLVILKKYKNGARRLLTSFHIDTTHYSAKLQKKYNRRLP